MMKNPHRLIPRSVLSSSDLVCNLNCSGNGECVHGDPADPSSSYICACYTGWKGTDCAGSCFPYSLTIKPNIFGDS